MQKTFALLNISITAITAILYAICLGMLFTERDYIDLATCLVVPALGFILCSVLRIVINAKRPYEVYNIENFLGKKTKGKSFPSRHVFCIFVIATSVLFFYPIFAIILYLLGVILCFLRVYARVHFVRDVVWGALFGIGVGCLCLLFN